jgi:hypothetical protein
MHSSRRINTHTIFEFGTQRNGGSDVTLWLIWHPPRRNMTSGWPLIRDQRGCFTTTSDMLKEGTGSYGMGANFLKTHHFDDGSSTTRNHVLRRWPLRLVLIKSHCAIPTQTTVIKTGFQTWRLRTSKQISVLCMLYLCFGWGILSI